MAQMADPLIATTFLPRAAFDEADEVAGSFTVLDTVLVLVELGPVAVVRPVLVALLLDVDEVVLEEEMDVTLNDRDVLVEAKAQNLCARVSAVESSLGHWDVTQSVKSGEKSALFQQSVEPGEPCAVNVSYRELQTVGHCGDIISSSKNKKNSNSDAPHVEYPLRLGSSAESVELALRLPLMLEVVLLLVEEPDIEDVGSLIAVPVTLPVMLVEVVVVDDWPRTTAMRQSSEKGTTLENPRGIDGEKKGERTARVRQQAQR
ncbi:uncharacterized protein ARMOST_20906 [Armillaria ostoyae]|uniref:Uncharacterized protein n=1 Tax=Armillaria ostoyae TaxID=47428 RepID=A0A284S8R4_ARMOS|nr:uncharacterized protein ARMOST_20906 [Armillaria ostoyae]